jgi:formate dehydrogenase subunit beta
MTSAISIENGPDEALREIMGKLIETGTIKGAITLTRSSEGSVTYGLITDASKVENAVPLHPLMPSNLGQVLGKITKRGGFREPILVVVRPCELRGFVELVKRDQACPDNLVFLSHTCGGVFPLEMGVNGEIDGLLDDYWMAIRGADVHTMLRPACRSCSEFVPYTSDMTMNLIGAPKAGVKILIHTPRGEEIVESLDVERCDWELDSEAMLSLRGKREAERDRLFESDAPSDGLDGLVNVFGRCIGCHACSKACPICYCTLCTFESSHSEPRSQEYTSELGRKGGMRIPSGTIYFHLGRMSHIGISCVACGSCQDVCPTDIPISILFKRVSESIQRTFDYIPGRDPSEMLPVCTFEEEELKEVED